MTVPMAAPTTEGGGATGHRRADIQGLRALAVAGVIAHHLTGTPQAGFLGVDVFFVVSGFVITGLLLRERERTGRTSLRDFYARRARRILPAALVVLGATVLAACWAFAPAKADGIATDALWAALFAGNWHLARQGADYFRLGEAPSPVQHFWSLGVEEQFYLVWPWLILLALAVAGASRRGRGRAAVAALTVVVAGGSLAWAAVQTPADAVTAYYSSLTRAWELALGGLLATIPAYAVRLAPGARAALSWAGVACIVVSFLALDQRVGTPFPGAVLPVVATLAVLVAGVGVAAPVAVLLTNPVSRYLGDISYGLYLWHFPLVVLGAAVLGEGPALWAAVVGGTLALAAISYHLLERPILDAPRRSSRPVADGSFAPSDVATARRAAWRRWWVARRRGMAAAAAALTALVVAVGGLAVANPSVLEPDSTSLSSDNGAVAAPSVPDVTTTTEPTPTASPTTTSAPSTAPAPTPTTTRPTTIPLGRTGEAIQAGLRGALATTSWPSRLNPSPDRWETTADQDPRMQACTATKASDPDSCTFGNPKGPEIVVYGDSLGFPLLATVVAAYGKTHKVRGLTKIACAVNGVDADFGKDDWAIPCVRHREMTIAYVKKAKPDVLIMTETYAWARKLKSGATGAAAGTEWLAADQAFVDAVKDSVGHVVIISPSIPGIAFMDCYRAGGSPKRCVTGVPSWWKAVADSERRVEDATFVDTMHWYCVDGRCPIFTRTGNTVLKGDYLHSTVQYARLVAPDLAYRLAYAGVLTSR
jgi:peptidoglycan/LPS O-acetylase OafA/YrhL